MLASNSIVAIGRSAIIISIPFYPISLDCLLLVQYVRSDERQGKVDLGMHPLHSRQYQLPETVSRVGAFAHDMRLKGDRFVVSVTANVDIGDWYGKGVEGRYWHLLERPFRQDVVVVEVHVEPAQGPYHYHEADGDEEATEGVFIAAILVAAVGVGWSRW